MVKNFRVPESKPTEWSKEELAQMYSGVPVEDIARELVGETLSRLEKVSSTGGELQALCPFHDDQKVGSFYLNPNSGLFLCFSCGAKGEFSKLAHKLQVADRGAFRGIDISTLLPLVLRDLGEERDIPPPVMELPVIPESLLDHMSDVSDWRGHPVPVLRALEVKYDPIYDRIVFPVRRLDGALLGMQSRNLNPTSRLRWKFYNAELPSLGTWDEDSILALYTYSVPRGSTFFGEYLNWGWFVKKDTAPLVLCEGPGHLLRITSTGFQGLATFGTTLSQRQVLRLQEGLSQKKDAQIILCYDADDSGRMAVERLSAQLAPYADVLIAQLPEGKDPEDLSVLKLGEVLRAALPYFQVGLENQFVPSIVEQLLSCK